MLLGKDGLPDTVFYGEYIFSVDAKVLAAIYFHYRYIQ